MQIHQRPIASSILGPNILFSNLFSNNLILFYSLTVTDKFHMHIKQRWISRFHTSHYEESELNGIYTRNMYVLCIFFNLTAFLDRSGEADYSSSVQT
jgi:hypothetical protein